MYILVFILQHEIKLELILSNYITIKQVQNIFVGTFCTCHDRQNKSHFVTRTNYRPCHGNTSVNSDTPRSLILMVNSQKEHNNP
jgi:hypothetical protein